MANAVDAARLLPDRAVELPVLAVSTALQFSLRAQQRYTELTLRGDELLGRLHGPPEEPPSWATFDDEDAAPADLDAAAEVAPPEDIPISAPTEAATVAPVKSPSKQPRARKSPAKKTTAAAAKRTPAVAKSSAKSSTAKSVRAPRQAKPSAFDRTDDE